jgi:predicted AAA+ superfamily ATPase
VREVPEKTLLHGEALEAWLHHELSAWVDYKGDGELRYWRSTSGFEVDFVLNGEVAIECKATRSVTSTDFRGLFALSEEVPMKRKIVVCFEPAPRQVQGIEIIPLREFLARLWRGDITG